MMRIRTINSLLIILSVITSLISCKKQEKTFVADEAVQEFYKSGDLSIFEKYVGCAETRKDLHTEGIDLSYYYLDMKNNPKVFLQFFVNDSDYSQGRILLMCHEYKKNKNSVIKRVLKDYAFLEGSENYYLMESYLSYGSPDREKVCSTDESKFGFFYEDTSKPRRYFTKIRPQYIVYVENEKLVVEEPKDDKYFIWLVPEL